MAILFLKKKTLDFLSYFLFLLAYTFFYSNYIIDINTSQDIVLPLSNIYMNNSLFTAH